MFYMLYSLAREDPLLGLGFRGCVLTGPRKASRGPHSELRVPQEFLGLGVFAELPNTEFTMNLPSSPYCR